MLYFLIYLFFEVVITINLASYIGGVATFFELILSALLGIAILINFRLILAQNLSALASRSIGVKAFQNSNLFTILGAFLLIIPGFLTDIIGILFQFSMITSLLLSKVIGKKYNDVDNNTYKKDHDVIDVEIISDSTSSK